MTTRELLFKQKGGIGGFYYPGGRVRKEFAIVIAGALQSRE
jgi:hypothetical protein